MFLMLLPLPFSASGATSFTQGMLKYTVTSGLKVKVELADKSTKQSVGTLEVPSTVENDGKKYTVTEISSFGTYNLTVTTLVYPETVTQIDNSALQVVGLKTIYVKAQEAPVLKASFPSSLTTVLVPYGKSDDYLNHPVTSL